MITWNILKEEVEYELEVGQITVLKGSNLLWYRLVRFVEDYFTNKNSEVLIYEGMHQLNKKEWECYFIPYNAHLQLDKLNSKSPLKPILDEICNDLTFTPAYHELLDIWNEILEEIHFNHQKIEKYGLTMYLEPFSHENLKSFLYFKTIQRDMTPIDYKALLLRLSAERKLEKKRLIIVELPELYAESAQYRKFIEEVNEYSKMGITFILVTQNSISGNCNFSIHGKIVNHARLEMIKRKVQNELPFVCDDKLYNEARQFLLDAVDNFNISGDGVLQPGTSSEAILVIIYSMIRHLNIGLTLDITGISPNLEKFIKSYW